jgi:ferritin-like metal-binding protein YciE
MAIFAYEFNNLEDLFLQQVEDLYDAETRLIDALPLMSQAASSPDLKQAFDSHLRETEGHKARLEDVFRRLGKEPKREACKAMQGLIKEGEEMISAKGDPKVKDAGLIAAAQRVEHYEMAGYGALRTYARQLGMQDVAATLQQTLDEEGDADKKLTAIAESHVNAEAVH